MEYIKLNYENKVANISIDKAKSLNALNTQVLKELKEVLSSDEVKDSRVVLIQGEGGKAFVAGADISEMQNFNSIQAKDFSNLGHSVFKSLESLSAVTVSLVDGFALGGGFELALSTDIILATEKSKFGLPEVSLGLIPGFGGTQRLSRSLGLHLAKALSLTGDMISAKELYDRALIYKIFETREAMQEESTALAKRISTKGPYAVSEAKKTIQKGYSLAFKEALNLEQQNFSLLFGTKEATEGVSAFVEKRKPNF